MKLQRGKRARLGWTLLVAIAAVAILALPSLASGHDRGHKPADAGVIGSFDADTGVLAIDLAKGGTISALVVDRTQIRCGRPHRRHHRGRGHGRSQRPNRGGEDGPGGEGRGPRQEGENPPGHDGTPPGSSEDPGRGAEHSAGCGTDNLVPGTTVKKAEIVLIDGAAYFRVVCLPRPDKPAPEGPGPEEGEGEGEEG